MKTEKATVGSLNVADVFYYRGVAYYLGSVLSNADGLYHAHIVPLYDGFDSLQIPSTTLVEVALTCPPTPKWKEWTKKILLSPALWAFTAMIIFRPDWKQFGFVVLGFILGMAAIAVSHKEYKK